jgi:hypothetical protein
MDSFDICRDEYPDEAEAIDPDGGYTRGMRRMLAELESRAGVDAGIVLEPWPSPPASVGQGECRQRTLGEVLDELEQRALARRRGAPRSEPWLGRTRAIFDRLIHYMEAILEDREGPLRVATLLRDCLLLHLGFRHLERHGRAVRSEPLMLGRGYLGTFFAGHQGAEELGYEPGEYAYALIVDALYRALGSRPSSLEALRSAFAQELPTSPEFHAAFDHLGQIATDLHRGHPFLVVESGVHGTMPMLFGLASPLATDFRVFTTLPWLVEIHGRRSFTRRVDQLRAIENVVCQEHLFFFESLRDGQTIVRASTSAETWEVATDEVALFLELVEERLCAAP